MITLTDIVKEFKDIIERKKDMTDIPLTEELEAFLQKSISQIASELPVGNEEHAKELINHTYE